jgi:hypothetical protein
MDPMATNTIPRTPIQIVRQLIITDVVPSLAIFFGDSIDIPSLVEFSFSEVEDEFESFLGRSSGCFRKASRFLSSI